MGDGAKKFRWPDDTQRTAIIGRTGSGKSQAGMFQLSMRSFDKMPWIIFDTKRDGLIGEIQGTKEIDYGKVPDEPGLYIIRPLPNEEEEIDEFLWKVWAQENTGIFVDEGYMIGDGDAFAACLTQGRSKHIPMIVLSQRPVWLSRFVWSESDFYQVFHLNDKDDRKAIQRFVSFDMDERLPEYWSRWYDVGQDAAFKLKPVPDRAAILARFADRLQPSVAPKPVNETGRNFRLI